MRKATHIGSCQCCGRVQKLPSGLLSLHGYTKQWGFFHGRCRGSGHEPFEVSKDLIERFIAESLDAITRLQMERSELLKPPTTPATKAWKRVYIKDARSKRSDGYQWRKGTVSEVERTYTSGGKELKFRELLWTIEQTEREVSQSTPVLTEKLTGGMDVHDGKLVIISSVVQFIECLNRKYVEQVINVEIDHHLKYIAWQRERIANWKLKPLIPVSTKADTQKIEALEALVKAGCTRKPHGYAGTLGWFHPKGWYLGRAVKAALAELKRIKGEVVEESDAKAIAELETRGARLMPYMRGKKTMRGWWIGDSLLGNSAVEALGELKRIEEREERQ